MVWDETIVWYAAIGLVALAGAIRTYAYKQSGGWIVFYLLIACLTGTASIAHVSTQKIDAQRRAAILQTLRPFCHDYGCTIDSVDVWSSSANLTFSKDCQARVGLIQVGDEVLRPTSNDFDSECASAFVTDLP